MSLKECYSTRLYSTRKRLPSVYDESVLNKQSKPRLKSNFTSRVLFTLSLYISLRNGSKKKLHSDERPFLTINHQFKPDEPIMVSDDGRTMILSRHFSENTNLVAGMCRNCYLARKEVRITQINRNYLNQIGKDPDSKDIASYRCYTRFELDEGPNGWESTREYKRCLDSPIPWDDRVKIEETIGGNLEESDSANSSIHFDEDEESDSSLMVVRHEGDTNSDLDLESIDSPRVEGDSDDDMETRNWNKSELKDEGEGSTSSLIGLNRLKAGNNEDLPPPKTYIKSSWTNEGDQSISSLMGLNQLEDLNEVDIERKNWNKSELKDEGEGSISSLIGLDRLKAGNNEDLPPPKTYIKSSWANEGDQSISSLIGLNRLEDLNAVDIETRNWNKSQLKDEGEGSISSLIGLNRLKAGNNEDLPPPKTYIKSSWTNEGDQSISSSIGLNRLEDLIEVNIETRNWNKSEFEDEGEGSTSFLIGLNRLKAGNNEDLPPPKTYIKSSWTNEGDQSISSSIGLNRLEDLNAVDIETRNWNKSELKDEGEGSTSSLIGLDRFKDGNNEDFPPPGSYIKSSWTNEGDESISSSIGLNRLEDLNVVDLERRNWNKSEFEDEGEESISTLIGLNRFGDRNEEDSNPEGVIIPRNPNPDYGDRHNSETLDEHQKSQNKIENASIPDPSFTDRSAINEFSPSKSTSKSQKEKLTKMGFGNRLKLNRLRNRLNGRIRIETVNSTTSKDVEDSHIKIGNSPSSMVLENLQNPDEPPDKLDEYSPVIFEGVSGQSLSSSQASRANSIVSSDSSTGEEYESSQREKSNRNCKIEVKHFVKIDRIEDETDFLGFNEVDCTEDALVIDENNIRKFQRYEEGNGRRDIPLDINKSDNVSKFFLEEKKREIAKSTFSINKFTSLKTSSITRTEVMEFSGFESRDYEESNAISSRLGEVIKKIEFDSHKSDEIVKRRNDSDGNLELNIMEEEDVISKYFARKRKIHIKNKSCKIRIGSDGNQLKSEGHEDEINSNKLTDLFVRHEESSFDDLNRFGVNIKVEPSPNLNFKSDDQISIKNEVKDEKFPITTNLTTNRNYFLVDPIWHPPRSPHNLIEEDLYHDPWALLVATIFLNKTAAKHARFYIGNFLRNYATPFAVIEAKPADFEKYFEKIGLQTTRSRQVWRMSSDFVRKDWKIVDELYGIGTYGRDAFNMFCLGDMDVQPSDRYLKIYKAWYERIYLRKDADFDQNFVDAVGYKGGELIRDSEDDYDEENRNVGCRGVGDGNL